MREGTGAHKFLVIAAFAAIYIIWGSTYLGIRFAIETIPPFTMAGIRFVAAGAIMTIWSRATGSARPSLVHWRSALIVGVLMLGGNGLLSWAEQFVASGVAALIVATVPLWMVAIDALRPGGYRPGLSVYFGLALGMAGIVILVGPSNLGSEPVHRVGAVVIALASFLWALGSVYSKTAPSTTSTIQNVGMQMLLGGIVLIISGILLGETLLLSEVSSKSLWALIYLITAGGIISYAAYLWLLQVSTPAKVSTYAFVNPIVAVILGWALAGEEINSRVLLSALSVTTAVILITTARSRKSRVRKLDELHGQSEQGNEVQLANSNDH